MSRVQWGQWGQKELVDTKQVILGYCQCPVLVIQLLPTAGFPWAHWSDRATRTTSELIEYKLSTYIIYVL